MPCTSRMLGKAREMMKRAEKAKTTEEMRQIDKELDALDICPEVKQHIRQHLYAGVHA